MSTTEQSATKGFALLISAPRAERHFVPLEGETIRILDKDGKELWSLKLPTPINNPGVTLYDVQIDLLTERDFGNFCQNTWNRGRTASPDTNPAAQTNPS
jgi:hypothetical protein